MLNIQQFLINKHIEFRKEGKNVNRGETNICCPFCGENRYHLGINVEKDIFACWKCSSAGDIAKLLSKLLGISYTEAKEIVDPQSDLKKVLEEREKKNLKVEGIIKPKNFKLPKHTYPFRQDRTNLWQEVALKFLREKYKLTWEHILDAKLNYCVSDKYKNCIIIPIYYKNQLVNFIGRVWDKNSSKRYLNCPNGESLYNTKTLLYNYDNIKIGQDKLLIVEGAFDCIKTGLDRSVALCGTEITQEQRNLIIGLKTKEVLILFDNDPHLTSTSKKAQELTNYLSAFVKTRVIRLPNGKDPGEMERDEIDNLII